VNPIPNEALNYYIYIEIVWYIILVLNAMFCHIWTGNSGVIIYLFTYKYNHAIRTTEKVQQLIALKDWQLEYIYDEATL
jgi:hypothetical protein